MMQVKKEISLLLIFVMIAALLTGCSDITTITLNEDGSGSYSETCTLSKELWDMSLGAIYKDDSQVIALYQNQFPGVNAAIADKTVDGVESREITMSMDFDAAGFERLMSMLGAVSVKFNENYFSRSALYTPADGGQEDISGLLPDYFNTLFGENEKLMAELQNMDVQLTITFPYEVTETNGEAQEDGKTVVWNLDQILQGNQNRCYAAFGEQDSTVSPSFIGAKNGKIYNSAVTLNVNSENLIDQVTVNGQTAASDYLSIMEEGTYRVTAKDKNGNTCAIKFQIDTTKPSISGVKNGAVYKKACKVKFSDKGSGIKKAALNGKKITSGSKVSKKGNYTLLVVDKAGNQKTVRFRVK